MLKMYFFLSLTAVVSVAAHGHHGHSLWGALGGGSDGGKHSHGHWKHMKEMKKACWNDATYVVVICVAHVYSSMVSHLTFAPTPRFPISPSPPRRGTHAQVDQMRQRVD